MELVFEQKGIVPGEEFWIGWRIIRERGWHTYWKHPGDVGVPPSIKWELPPGFVAGELLYSLPQKVKMATIRANGNYGETLFLTKVQAPPPRTLPETDAMEPLRTGPTVIGFPVFWVML